MDQSEYTPTEDDEATLADIEAGIAEIAKFYGTEKNNFESYYELEAIFKKDDESRMITLNQCWVITEFNLQIRGSIARFLRENRELDTNLRNFVADLLVTKIPPRRNYRRDMAIVTAIMSLTSMGFKATRNPATNGGSAIDVLVETLSDRYSINLSYDAVAKIWSKRHKVFNRFGLNLVGKKES